MELKRELYINSEKEQAVKYLLTNDNGMKVEILELGATLTKIVVPDKDGNYENVILEWQDINTYEQNPGYIGAVIGRVAGRIHQGKITIQDKVYNLSKNEGGNTLHGGNKGFHTKVWRGKDVSSEELVKLELTCRSEDQEEGFPGNLDVKVTYTLDNTNELAICYEAKTDKTTVVNLTNHAYFNLSGNGKRKILNHEVCIDSDKICELDVESIPTGKYIRVDEDKAFDFRKQKVIDKDIHAESQQIKYGNGYDHIWVLNTQESPIVVCDPISQRRMEIRTTEPCVVMYTMNNLPSQILDIHEQDARYGVCFETQKRPIGYEEIFKEEVLLNNKSAYKSCTKYKFDVI